MRIMTLQLAAAALSLAPLGAQAATYTWSQGNGTGNANQVWGISANWVGSPTLTFNSTTDLIFDNASVVNRANAIAIGGNRTIRSISIGANYVGSSDLTFDIQTYQTINSTVRNLTFEAASGNASLTLAQSTAGTVQVRFGHANGGYVILNSNLDIAQNNTFLDTSGNGLWIEGKLQGSGDINKTGAGLLRILRDNTNWTGNMNINEGAVQVGNDADRTFGQGAWTLGGGTNNTTLIVRKFFNDRVTVNPGGIVVAAGAGTRTIANTALDGGGILRLGGNVTLNKDAIFDVASHVVTTGDSMTLSGNVTGTGGIVKTNTGILVLSGTNTYAGSTVVEAGTLKLGTALAVSNSVGFTMNGGVLDLNGFTVTNAVLDSSVAGPGGVVSNGTLAVTTTVAPGGSNTVGSVTLPNAPDLSGTLWVDVTSGGACDQLKVTGSLSVDKLNLRVVDTNLLDKASTYTIAQCTGGTATGPFLSDNLPSAWKISYQGDRIVLRFLGGTLIRFF